MDVSDLSALLQAARKAGAADLLVIPGSPNRSAALMNGQIDATPLFLSDGVNIRLQQPDKFHVLKAFAEGFIQPHFRGLYTVAQTPQQAIAQVEHTPPWRPRAPDPRGGGTA